jgi:hypothetical protein
MKPNASQAKQPSEYIKISMENDFPFVLISLTGNKILSLRVIVARLDMMSNPSKHMTHCYRPTSIADFKRR